MVQARCLYQTCPTGTGNGQKRPVSCPGDRSYTPTGGLSLSQDNLYTLDAACLSPTCPNFCLFVCLFVVIKPGNPYFASRLGLEVKCLGVYPFGPRSSSSGPTKGTPPWPPRTTLRTIWGNTLARGKRRGFSPAAAARHSQPIRAYTDSQTVEQTVFSPTLSGWASLARTYTDSPTAPNLIVFQHNLVEPGYPGLRYFGLSG